MVHNALHRILAIAIVLSWTATLSLAEDDFGVKLMRPDSLVGWQYGEKSPAGWIVTDGVLSGTKDSTPLLSGFTAGDSELRLRWSVAEKGAWKLLLPEVPNKPGLSIVFREGDGCGRISDGDKQLHAGAKMEAKKDGMHTAALRRSGDKITLKVDGKQLWQLPLPGGRRFGLGLQLTEGKGTLADLRGSEPAGTSLIGGNDLKDWWCPGNKKAWVVEDGEMVLHPDNGNYLRTNKEYGNFVLSFDYNIKDGGNSGVGIRTPRAGWPSGDGMELQILHQKNHPRNAHDAASIYGNVPALDRAYWLGEYNQMVIKADGWLISVWVNGELVQHANTLEHPELRHRYLKGWVGLQDHNAEIHFRNLCILEAPDGTGLDAWYRTHPKNANAVVIDRIMNTDTLSKVDGLTSGVVSKTVDGDQPGEHVLAEFIGPGAVVRIARTNDEGQLAFFFDGEKKPRIKCKAADLMNALPMITEDGNPVPTCLAYTKSLKIVLSDAKKAEYRIDYVNLSKSVEAETFVSRNAMSPRGWNSAAKYRAFRNKFNWAGPREFDPIPRLKSEKKAIDPGESQELIHLDGTGVVHMVRLEAPKEVLDNDDLWLEVTIDGEDKPAVSAPARYWFPSLAKDQGNYRNYLLVRRHGKPTLFLAMPFADGWTFTASNRGKKKIDGLSLEIAAESATDKNREEIAKRLRLRGTFQPASDGTNEIINTQGTGRWIGLVYAEPSVPAGIAALEVDGEAVDGWAAPNLGLLLGSPEEEFRSVLSGRRRGLSWRYLLMAPVDFEKSLALTSTDDKVGSRLALFYMAK